MAEKIVSTFLNNCLPHLLNIESNALNHHLTERVKTSNIKKFNTIEGRKALNHLLEVEITHLKQNSADSCIIIARIFRERYNLKEESDDDLIMLLKSHDPTQGFDFFLRNRDEQKKLFHRLHKKLNSPRLQLTRRVAKIDSLLVEQHFTCNLNHLMSENDELSSYKRILLKIFKGIEGLGFDSFFLAFNYFFTIKNYKKLESMDDEALRIISPQLPDEVLHLSLVFCYWKWFGKIKSHYFNVFLECVHVAIKEYHVCLDNLFGDDEELKKLLTSLDELMFVEVDEQFLSSDEDEDEEKPTETKKI